MPPIRVKSHHKHDLMRCIVYLLVMITYINIFGATSHQKCRLIAPQYSDKKTTGLSCLNERVPVLPIRKISGSCVPHSYHPFYVSVTDAHYKIETRTLEIAQKVFWDDLESALAQKHEAQVDLVKGLPEENLFKWIQSYTLQHHTWTVNGKKLVLEFMGYEIEEDVIWLYLKAKEVPLPKNIHLHNSLLTDFLPEQKNITHIYRNEKPQSILTDRNRVFGVLEY